MKYIVILFCGFWGSITGQNLSSIYDGNNIKEIKIKADVHFDQYGKGKGSGYKQFMRWWGIASARYGEGEQFNAQAKIYEEYDKIQTKFARSKYLRSTHGNWEDLGPTDYTASDVNSSGGIGRINTISFHPENPLSFWIGTTAGGSWSTEDHGVTWIPQTDGLAQLGIASIAFDPNEPSTMYLLTGDEFPSGDTRSIGLFKSTDSGGTWLKTGLSWDVTQSRYAYKILIHPTNTQKIYVASSSGLHISEDGGINWTNLYSNESISDIEFSPFDDNIVFMTAISRCPNKVSDCPEPAPRFYRSTDAGSSFTNIVDPNFPDTSYRAELAISSVLDSSLYIIFGGGKLGMDGVLKSNDSGLTWTLQNNTQNILASNGMGLCCQNQAYRNIEIVVDPQYDSILYVGGINLWKSKDSGVNWDRKTWWTRGEEPVTPYVHADFLDLKFKGDTLYACNDGGVYFSIDRGAEWNEITKGLGVMTFYEIDVLGTDWIGGTQDNGTNGTDISNSQAKSIKGGDGFGAVKHTGDNSIEYLTSQNTFFRRQFGVSENKSPIDLPGDDEFWFSEVEMHSTDPDYVFVSAFNEIYRGNGSSISFSWDSLYCSSFFTRPNGISGYVQGINDPMVMYASNGKEVMRCLDITSSNPVWNGLSGIPLDTSQAFFQDVEIDPLDYSKVWVVAGGFLDGQKVYYSADTGNTWLNISGTLPNVPIRCIVYQPGSNDGIYIGSEIGVFYTDNDLADWIYFGNGLPNVIVQDLDIEGSFLYAGTFGRGLWKTDLYSSCPPDLVLTQANDPSISASTGTQIYHASQTIKSSRIISGGQGSEVFYNAGSKITLVPGFRAAEGNFMEARLTGCN